MPVCIIHGRAGFARKAADVCRGRRYRAGGACGPMTGGEPMELDP
jgi:hypothetical protein